MRLSFRSTTLALLAASCATVACSRTTTLEDPGWVCARDDDTLWVNSDTSLRRGCDDEVLQSSCEVDIDGDRLQVRATFEIHEGPPGCSRYDDAFEPTESCSVPAEGVGLDVVYGGQLTAWDDLPSCEI